MTAKGKFLAALCLLSASGFLIIWIQSQNSPQLSVSESENNQAGASEKHAEEQATQSQTSPVLTSGAEPYKLTADDIKSIAQQGGDTSQLYVGEQVMLDTRAGESQREQAERKEQEFLPPTPEDLKNAVVFLDNFLGSTNTTIQVDIISMKHDSLKFRFLEKDWDYSGHYAVRLNTPRSRVGTYSGFLSPDKAQLVILETAFDGKSWPLPDAIVWEKSDDFIDVESEGKEWIYSGTYTIQN
jgi:hypothetical protein